MISNRIGRAIVPSMNGSQTIKNLIFDLGNVVIRLRIERCVAAMRQWPPLQEKSDADMEAIMALPLFHAFETGSLSEEAFRNAIRSLLGEWPVSDEEIDKAWNSMLGPLPSENEQVLQQLAARYRLFLFSNTNAIHMRYYEARLREEFGYPVLRERFEKCFFSHELQLRKPSVEAFHKVIGQAGVDPAETLFIDDLPANVEAAVKSGMFGLRWQAGTNLTDLLV